MSDKFQQWPWASHYNTLIEQSLPMLLYNVSSCMFDYRMITTIFPASLRLKSIIGVIICNYIQYALKILIKSCNNNILSGVSY